MDFILVLIALAVLFFCLFGLNFLLTHHNQSLKYKSIEGLRGYLAFFVFLHHSSVWHDYLKTGDWHSPASGIFSQAGECGVAFFFMITGFLFSNKLLIGKNKPINWTAYFKARILRLGPMYFFTVSVLIFIVFAAGGFVLNTSPGRLIDDCSHWYFFTLVGSPNIDGYNNTYTIIAGVRWSLVYEWMFYLFVPIAAFLFYKIKTSSLVLFFCTVLLIIIYIKNEWSLIHLLTFVSGVLASFLVKNEKLIKIFRHWAASFIILFCLLIIAIFSHHFTIIPWMLATIIFCIVACGNTFFGILHAKSSQILGQMSYSIYLLHGIVLYVVMNFILGIEKAKSLSDTKYCLVIAACILPLIVISSTTYHFIEAKFTGKGYKKKRG